MRKTISILFLLLIAIGVNAKTVNIKILETTDVHGAFFPNMGKVCTYVEQQRKLYGDNLILLDAGDILQGEPCSYYYNYVNVEEENLASKVINFMKYDAQTFGNHDVETGHAVYDKWTNEVKCPSLGANIIDKSTGKPYAQPYIVLKRNGIKIAILGMLTPAIPNWLDEEKWQGLYFEDIKTSCKKWIKIIREKEKPDFIIGLFHSGLNGGIERDGYCENASEAVAYEVDGFDAIMFGHDHQKYCQMIKNNYGKDVWLLNSANKAYRVAELSIVVKGKKKTLVGTLHDIGNETPSSTYNEYFASDMQKIQDFMDEPIGTFEDEMATKDAFFGNSKYIDFIHKFQLDFTKADISINAPLVYNKVIRKGTVTRKDMFSLYVFENTLNVVRMTGKEIKGHLEYSYDKWVNTMTSADDEIFVLKGKSFKNRTYNFDSAAGIIYNVDVTKPYGQKVQILSMSDGTPFDENKTYRVAMNSYRANGGGELLTKGAGIAKDEIEKRVEYTSELDLRHYLTEYIKEHKTIKLEPGNNWKFIPSEITQPALERSKAMFK